jgi:hypothetical protein
MKTYVTLFTCVLCVLFFSCHSTKILLEEKDKGGSKIDELTQEECKDLKKALPNAEADLLEEMATTKSPNPYWREVRAAAAMHLSDHDNYIPTLLNLLKDPDWIVRASTAIALGSKDPGSLPFLETAYDRERNPIVIACLHEIMYPPPEREGMPLAKEVKPTTTEEAEPTKFDERLEMLQASQQGER